LFHSDQKPYPYNYGVVADLLKASHKKNPDELKAPLEARFPLPVHLSGAGHETVVRGLGDDPSAGPLANAIGSTSQPDEPSKVLDKGTPTWQGIPKPPKPTPEKVQRQPARRGGPPSPGEGAITSARLGRLGTAEETQFRKDVYDAQMRRTM